MASTRGFPGEFRDVTKGF